VGLAAFKKMILGVWGMEDPSNKTTHAQHAEQCFLLGALAQKILPHGVEGAMLAPLA